MDVIVRTPVFVALFLCDPGAKVSRGGIFFYILETDGFDIAIITLTILSKSSTVSSPFAS